MNDDYPSPSRRILITIPAMIAATMVAVDITIANVALPHMQASVMASQEQIVWVLTSYLMAGAIATPLTGWLAERYGRQLVMAASVLGFTLASALCGLANDIQTIVFARILQGACGAGLIPLSQATLLDINPPEEYPKAMAIFSVGSMAGPILGPTLGGFLTDSLSWRWVFFINIPFGIVSFIGMTFFMFERREHAFRRFDMFGFVALSIALAAFQLLIDRGELLDWFDSLEIQLYAVICGLALYLGAVHMFTAGNPFIRPELFRDRNYAIGSLINVTTGVVAFATVPLIVVMTQNLLGYSAFRTGMIGMPRAIGSVISILMVTRLVAFFDIRILLMAGLAITGISMAMHASIDLYVDQTTLVILGFVQGFGGGLLFVPLSIIVFLTLKPNLRNEGAAMYALTRNIGNAIGISFLNRELIHRIAASRAHLVEGIRPDNPAMQGARPDFDFGSVEALSGMSNEIARQSSMVGNVEVYWLVFLLTMIMIPTILLMRKGSPQSSVESLPNME